MIPEFINDVLSETFTNILNDLIPSLIEGVTNTEMNFFLEGFALCVTDSNYTVNSPIYNSEYKSGDYPLHTLSVEQPTRISIANARVIRNLTSNFLNIEYLKNIQQMAIPIFHYSILVGFTEVLIDNISMTMVKGNNIYSFSLKVLSFLKEDVSQLVNYVDEQNYEGIEKLKDIFDKFKNKTLDIFKQATSSFSSRADLNIPFIYRHALKHQENPTSYFFTFDIVKNTVNKQKITCKLPNGSQLSFDVHILKDNNNAIFEFEDGTIFDLNSKYTVIKKENINYVCNFKTIYRYLETQITLDNLFEKYFLVITF